MKYEEDQTAIDWIFIAKGIGIFLVVIGHFNPDISPVYWSKFREIIYLFHMPLFFFLSGYLYIHGKYSYFDLLKTKTKRLLFPFISISIIFFLVKSVAGLLVKINHPVNIESLYALLVNPVNSYMPLLWFVHALFLIFAIYSLARLYMNDCSLLIIFIAINSVLGNDFLVFGKALYNIPFFIIGAILRDNQKFSKKLIGSNYRYIFFPLILFSLIYISGTSLNITIYSKYIVRVLVGILGSIFVINLSHAISKFSTTKTKDVLVVIGYYSMTIYLFHTLFESTIRIGFLQVLKNVQVPFELIAFAAVCCGVIFPLIIEKKVLRKFMLTRKYLLGIS